MELKEAREKFIQTWGALGSNWGINRSMAQVHALLLVSPSALSTEDVMTELNISRGNANMNLRDLIDWGLVSKVIKSGERREFFEAEKDMWKVAMQIVKQRKKRELDPVLKVMLELNNVEGDKSSDEYKAYSQTIKGITQFSNKADSALETFLKADESWFLSTFMKMLK
ncbi:GbsR/MarR family transcriptional regulator [Solitalea canadensis]|uniref:HTH-type transcriptional regulator n=1 Tax=Solitalea canadensis (strain ATCC 29591 / DSM 3403 / JCM 21819 / LMG 8368 / NBRC 15130 / NCIMB 12057 / USAM 9D) TaxID=929556 RepID=H8KWD2_SOLCM|nr:transcriptional regulator [Solitalea canadensis]AFD07924.1 putative transcriptional regulator [Solitalea canadensis DSM 3403]